MIFAGYYGANDWEAAQVDMIMDCMDDIIKPILPMMFNKNEAEKVTVGNAEKYVIGLVLQ